MGYRHGPSLLLTALVFGFCSNNRTRQYDLDILDEIGRPDAALTIGIEQEGNKLYGRERLVFQYLQSSTSTLFGSAFVMVAQVVALLNSVRVNNKPDTQLSSWSG